MLEDIEASDLHGDLVETNGSLTLRDLRVLSSVTPGELFEADMGDVVIDGLLIEGCTLTAGSSWGFLDFEELASANIQDLSFRDNTMLLSRSEGQVYAGGLLLLTTNGDALLDGVLVEGNRLELDAPSAWINGAWLGWAPAGSGEGAVVARHVRVVDNEVVATEGTHIDLGALVASGDWSFENLVVAANRVEHCDPCEGLLAGDEVHVTNADFVDNALSGTGDWYGLFTAWDAIALTNVNLVGNTASGAADDATHTLWNPNGTFDWSYGNAWDNDLPGTLLQTGGDPQYTDRQGLDFTLAANSICVDAGDPTILDGDGSVSDIGAYGGPLGGAW